MAKENVKIQLGSGAPSFDLEIEHELEAPAQRKDLPDEFDGEFLELEGGDDSYLTEIGRRDSNDVMFLDANVGHERYTFEVHAGSRKFHAVSTRVNPKTRLRGFALPTVSQPN